MVWWQNNNWWLCYLMSYKRLEFTAAWFFIKHRLQEKKSWNHSDFCPCCKCLFPEIGAAHKDWWTMLKLVDTEMSPVPSQAVIMNGTICLLSSLPLPSRPLQPLVFHRGTLTECLMEEALRRRSSFIESKRHSFTQDLPSNHWWRPSRPSFTAGGWSALPMVT